MTEFEKALATLLVANTEHAAGLRGQLCDICELQLELVKAFAALRDVPDASKTRLQDLCAKIETGHEHALAAVEETRRLARKLQDCLGQQ